MNTTSRNYYWIVGISIALLLLLYAIVDPAQSNWFPKCPFLWLTGYQCPGCGSQRAIHQLLQGNLNTAFAYNPLLVIALPYVFLGVLFEIPTFKNQYLTVQRFLFGYKTIRLIFVIIISFWILRNII